MFVSYRQSDGKDTVAELCWLLRAAGVPVWHDQTDLPPGETEQRLDEALAAGLSGAVLVITPDIALSGVVQHVELPRLLALSAEPDFVLAVANTIRNADGKLAYAKPDELLNQPRTLGGLKQYPADSRDGLRQLVASIVADRARRLPTRDSGEPLHIRVQTRGRPITFSSGTADVAITLRPGQFGRLPDRHGLQDLADTLPLLADTYRQSGATGVRVTGGAHLSVAYALGAALPATLVGTFCVEDANGQAWSCASVSAGGSGLVRSEARGMNPAKRAGTPHAVVAYVDLLPTKSDAAYTRLLGERQDFDAWEYLRAAAPGVLDPETAGPLLQEVADQLRSLAQRHNNATLHLLLRCPYPAAVLLGRLCNTMKTVVYEWDDTEVAGDDDHRPRFVASLRVRAGTASGPIDEVLLDMPTAGAAA